MLRDPGGGRAAGEAPEDLTPCEVMEEGHIVVRGACVTAGYEYRDHMGGEDPNARAWTSAAGGGGGGGGGRFLCTGDKGYIDEDGHLNLTGRFKEIINYGGEKLSPLESEDVLLKHAAVRDMICFAMPHEELGEVVGAALVLHEGATLTLPQLRGFGLQQGLALHKCPQVLVRFPDSIPKGHTGKPARIGLAQKLGLAPLPREVGAGRGGGSWDVEGAQVGHDGKTRYVVREPTVLRDFLLAEDSGSQPAPAGRAPTPPVPALGAASWASHVRAFVLPSLRARVAAMLGLLPPDVPLDAPLLSLGVESMRLVELQDVLSAALGLRVGILQLGEGSLTELAEGALAALLPPRQRASSSPGAAAVLPTPGGVYMSAASPASAAIPVSISTRILG